jgi:Protein of unknown function (DUF2567)
VSQPYQPVPDQPVPDQPDQPQPPAGPSTRDDLVVAGVIVGALAVLGALLGLVWSAWSPPGSPAIVIGGGTFEVLGESENQIAADGRFLVIVTVVGLLAGLFAWFGRPRNRGPLVLLGLVVGGLCGAALTDLVGHLSGGGSFSGRKLGLTDGSKQEVTLRLPLSLHMPGMLFVEAALAALLYGLFTAFAVHDDLGRPDPVRDELRAGRGGPPPDEISVGAGHEPQGGWGYGDGPGPLQQREFPPQ